MHRKKSAAKVRGIQGLMIFYTLHLEPGEVGDYELDLIWKTKRLQALLSAKSLGT